MTFDQDLDIYMRARFTLIVLVTPEEQRALQTIKEVCQRANRPLTSSSVARRVWYSAQDNRGFLPFVSMGITDQPRRP